MDLIETLLASLFFATLAVAGIILVPVWWRHRTEETKNADTEADPRRTGRRGVSTVRGVDLHTGSERQEGQGEG